MEVSDYGLTLSREEGNEKRVNKRDVEVIYHCSFDHVVQQAPRVKHDMLEIDVQNQFLPIYRTEDEETSGVKRLARLSGKLVGSVVAMEIASWDDNCSREDEEVARS